MQQARMISRTKHPALYQSQIFLDRAFPCTARTNRSNKRARITLLLLLSILNLQLHPININMPIESPIHVDNPAKIPLRPALIGRSLNTLSFQARCVVDEARQDRLSGGFGAVCVEEVGSVAFGRMWDFADDDEEVLLSGVWGSWFGRCGGVAGGGVVAGVGHCVSFDYGCNRGRGSCG
jgi:hypothetical protein